MSLSLNVGCVVTGHGQWWQDREPLRATAPSCGQLPTPVSVTHRCITTTPKTRALEQEFSVFAPTSVDLQVFCASTLGLVGMILLPTSGLWPRSTHISYSGAKAGRPAATHGNVFSWQQQRLEMLSGHVWDLLWLRTGTLSLLLIYHQAKQSTWPSPKWRSREIQAVWRHHGGRVWTQSWGHSAVY